MELPFDPVIPLLGIYQETQNTNSKEHIHPYVHCSVIYYSQDLEAAQVSISKQVDKKIVAHLHSGIRLRHKKEGKFTFCNRIDEPGEHCAKQNKPVTEKDKYDMISLSRRNQMNKIN